MKSLNKSILMALFLGIFSNNFFGMQGNSLPVNSGTGSQQQATSPKTSKSNIITNNPKTSMGVLVAMILAIAVGYYFWSKNTKGKEEKINSKQQ